MLPRICRLLNRKEKDMNTLKTKLKVLIVDDNKKLCKNLSDILEFKGYETVAVYDGYQAIEAVKNNKFNAILMDVKMPGINGIDTLKVLKQIVPHTLVIMITAFADDIFYKEGLNNGEFEIIQKPIDINKLLGMLKNTHC